MFWGNAKSGYKSFAVSLSYYNDPKEIVHKLFLANEVRTYPILFGLGGTANYDLKSLKDDPSLLQTPLRGANQTLPSIIPPDLDILLRGIGIQVNTMKPDEIVEFHVSDYGKHLRDAVQYFEQEAGIIAKRKEDLDLENFFAAAEHLQKAMREAGKSLSTPSFRKKIKKTEERLELFFRAGGLAVGGLLGGLIGRGPLEIIGGAAIIDQIVFPKVRHKIVDAVVKKLFSPGIANLWKILKGRNYPQK
ncbi:hypothetical protein ES703_116014 [subsurface metagenome]